MKNQVKRDTEKLVQWFKSEKRPLPWRKSKDPYKIWISEIMLQQTTAKAVVPYFNRFIERFPNVTSLAQAKIEDVYQQWAGLGYYSRARNLHKAALALAELDSFPKTHQELLKLPGFGDYTARAVSSQAFEEEVGVVDGNVIRVLSRQTGIGFEHWKNKEKKKIQDLADQYAFFGQPSMINQALMELGATLCSPINPTCLLCPIRKNCQALKNNSVKELPLKKPRRESEIWVWNVDLYANRGRIAFLQNDYAPWLKKQWILPGKVKKQNQVPQNYDFKHAITHHKIFIKINKKQNIQSIDHSKKIQWILRKQISEKVPFSIIEKAVQAAFPT